MKIKSLLFCVFITAVNVIYSYNNGLRDNSGTISAQQPWCNSPINNAKISLKNILAGALGYFEKQSDYKGAPFYRNVCWYIFSPDSPLLKAFNVNAQGAIVTQDQIAQTPNFASAYYAIGASVGENQNQVKREFTIQEKLGLINSYGLPIQGKSSSVEGLIPLYINYANMNLDGADFSGSTVSVAGSQLPAKYLTQILWRRYYPVGFGFIGSSLKNANFSEAVFYSKFKSRSRNAIVEAKSTFENANLTNAKFVNARCEGVDFTNANLTGVDFTGATFTSDDVYANFKGSTLKNITFKDSPDFLIALVQLGDSNFLSDFLDQANDPISAIQMKSLVKFLNSKNEDQNIFYQYIAGLGERIITEIQNKNTDQVLSWINLISQITSTQMMQFFNLSLSQLPLMTSSNNTTLLLAAVAANNLKVVTQLLSVLKKTNTQNDFVAYLNTVGAGIDNQSFDALMWAAYNIEESNDKSTAIKIAKLLINYGATTSNPQVKSVLSSAGISLK